MSITSLCKERLGSKPRLGSDDWYEEAKYIVDGDLSNLHDPFLMKGMKIAVDRILKAIMGNEILTVFADYDVDGVSSAAFLIHFFRDLGIPIRYYLPNRMVE